MTPMEKLAFALECMAESEKLDKLMSENPKTHVWLAVLGTTMATIISHDRDNAEELFKGCIHSMRQCLKAEMAEG